MMRSYEPRAMREIHEIREQFYLETKQLSPEERAERSNRIGKKIAEKYGLKIKQRV